MAEAQAQQNVQKSEEKLIDGAVSDEQDENEEQDDEVQ